MTVDYPAVIVALYPGAEFVLRGTEYDGLEWLSDTPKPTQQELDDAWPAVQQARQQAEVDALRHAAYVTESDPLFFQYQAGEITEQEWLDKRAEIKSRYPNYKPEEGS